MDKLYSPTKQMHTSSSAYCLRGRFCGTMYSLLLVRIYPISYAEERQIHSAFVPRFLALLRS